MDTYYSRLARSILFKAEREVGKVQDYLVEGDANTELKDRADCVLKMIHTLQDEILRAGQEWLDSQ